MEQRDPLLPSDATSNRARTDRDNTFRFSTPSPLSPTEDVLRRNEDTVDNPPDASKPEVSSHTGKPGTALRMR
jgi:hypothetical protein